jgi:hypothetical protein
LGTVALMFYIAFNPEKAMALFTSLGATVGVVLDGFGSFFTNLVG